MLLALEVAVLTAAVLRVEVLIDGVQRILLLAAMFPGLHNVPDTLVQEGVLALPYRAETGVNPAYWLHTMLRLHRLSAA